jgi:hypothetical protein
LLHRLQARYGHRLRDLGVAVHSVTVQDLHPPPEVVEAYYDLTRAQTEKDRVTTEARIQAETAIARESTASHRLKAEAHGRWETARAQARAERDVFLRMAHVHRLLLVEPWLLPVPSPAMPWDVTWRCQRGALWSSPRALTQFRLTVEAAEHILGGRAKVIHDPAVPAPTLVNPDILRLRLPPLGRERPRPPMADEP